MAVMATMREISAVRRKRGSRTDSVTIFYHEKSGRNCPNHRFRYKENSKNPIIKENSPVRRPDQFYSYEHTGGRV